MTARDGEATAALRAVAAARAAVDRAEAELSRRRGILLDRMVEAATTGDGELISRIAKYARYEQAYVRRQLRAAGVQPKQPNRTPPPGFRARVDSE